MKRLLVDTNVFLYARGGDHPYRDACRQIVRATGDGRVALVASTELVQEFSHVLLRRGASRDNVVAQAREVSALCDLRPFDRDILTRALSLLEASSSLGVRDAVHAATGLEAGIHEVCSTDRVFDQLPDVTRVDPATLAIEVGA